MESGTFPTYLKQVQVLPILKKATLDPDITSSYRPISNLSYLSEIIERVGARRFNMHISNSHLLPVWQPAYSIQSVHNDLVVDNGQVSHCVTIETSPLIVHSTPPRQLNCLFTMISYYNCSFITSRLDYCNSVTVTLSSKKVAKSSAVISMNAELSTVVRSLNLCN